MKAVLQYLVSLLTGDVANGDNKLDYVRYLFLIRFQSAIH